MIDPTDSVLYSGNIQPAKQCSALMKSLYPIKELLLDSDEVFMSKTRTKSSFKKIMLLQQQ